MERHDFYQSSLNKVSRSFAFCIERLENPLRDWVALSYLLFRILDTIEDGQWQDLELQRQSFQQFTAALLNPATIQVWEKTLSGIQVSTQERELLQEAPRLMFDFHQLPSQVRTAIFTTLNTMARGMSHFMQRRPLRLLNMAELNQYCFFVAGIIGELLSQLRDFAHPRTLTLAQGHRMEGFHFGLFLQKINILKDQQQDENEGRFLVPNRTQLLLSLRLHAERAKEYLFAIPATETDYRLFCGWSLFLGLASLPWIQSSWGKKVLDKIPRVATQILLRKIETIIHENHQLESLFQQLIQALDAVDSLAPHQNATKMDVDKSADIAIFAGILSPMELQQLQLI